MKKIISMAALVVLVFSALALTACGGGSSASSADLSDSKYVGTWKSTEMTLADESEELGTEWQLVLNADGTGESIGEEETENFTWEPTKDGFKTKGDIKLTFTDDGDNIKTKILGANVIFVKVS